VFADSREYTSSITEMIELTLLHIAVIANGEALMVLMTGMDGSPKLTLEKA